MSETTWTPGPWVAEELPDYCEDTGAPLGTFFTGNFFRSGAAGGTEIVPFEKPENARLIAAAPEMADALQPVIDMARSYLSICPDRRGDSIAAIERAEAALSLATGGAR